MLCAQYDGTPESIDRIKALGVLVERVPASGNPFDNGWRVGAVARLLWIGDWVTVHLVNGVDVMSDADYRREFLETDAVSAAA